VRRSTVLLLLSVTACSAEHRVPDIACRWQSAGLIEDTVADRCLMAVVVENSSVGDSCSGEAQSCTKIESGSLEWFRDGWTTSRAEVLSFYVDCQESCADYGYE
jgi:hypothetical protein